MPPRATVRRRRQIQEERELLPPCLAQVDRVFVTENETRLSYFAGCDYFRLSSHPEVIAAVRAQLPEQAITVGASRKTTGNHPAYGALERQLAEFFAAPSALLVADGYLANLAVAQGWAGEFTHALLDERAHAALVDAATFLRCEVRIFPHRNATAAAAAARRCGRAARLVLLTDGLFAHSGQVAPLPEYRRLLPRGAWLMVDDAHGAGVLGRHGRGTVEELNLSPERLVQTITLSKAFGVFGGVVLGPDSVRAQILRRSRLFAGHTPLPLPLAGAASAAVRLLSLDRTRRRQLLCKASYVKAALREAGIETPEGPGPIVALHPANDRQRERVQRALRTARIHPPLIRYGTLHRDAYFRFVISSEHTPAQLDALVETLSQFPRSFRRTR